MSSGAAAKRRSPLRREDAEKTRPQCASASLGFPKTAMEPVSSGILLLSPVGRVNLQNSQFNPMAFCVVTVPFGQKLGVAPSERSVLLTLFSKSEERPHVKEVNAVPAPGEARPTLLPGAGKEYRNEQGTCQAPCRPPERTVFAGAVSSATATVEGHDLERRGLDAFEAADVDGGHGSARRAIYVPHVFQKKSKTVIATPRPEIDLIRKRLRVAADHYRTNYGEEPDDG